MKKRNKFISTLAAAAMVAVMAGATLPTTALAEETNNDDLHVSKSAKLEDDGTYTINLEAYATGKVNTTTTIEKEPVPADIILILDQSGSMNKDMTGIPSDIYDPATVTNAKINEGSYYYKVGDQYYKVTATKELVSSGLQYVGDDGKIYQASELSNSWTRKFDGQVYYTARPFVTASLKTFTRTHSGSNKVPVDFQYVNDNDSNEKSGPSDYITGHTGAAGGRYYFVNGKTRTSLFGTTVYTAYGVNPYTAEFHNDGAPSAGDTNADDPYYVAASYIAVTQKEVNTYRYTYTYVDGNGQTVTIGTSETDTEEAVDAANASITLYTRGTTTGSRLDGLKYAANQFISAMEATGVDHRIAVVGFASDGYKHENLGTLDWENTELFVGRNQYNYNDGNTGNNDAAAHYSKAFQDVSTAEGKANVVASIDALGASGATYPQWGFTMAQGIYEKSKNTYTKEDGTQGTRNRIVIFFTDGYPGYNDQNTDSTEAYTTIEKANTLKNTYGADVYCVACIESLTDGSDADTYLKKVSSDGTYQQATTAEALDAFFESIEKEVTDTTTTTSVQLTENAVLVDELSSYFTVPDDFNVTKNVTVQTAQHQGYESFSIPNDATGLTVTPRTDSQNKVTGINVSGFNYVSEENMVTTDDNGGSVKATGNKLVVTITGLLAKDEAATGVYVDTNTASSGIWDKDSDDQWAEIKAFPMPHTLLDKKFFVLDYAKKTALDAYNATRVDSAEDGLFSKVGKSSTSLSGDYGSVDTNGGLSYTPSTTIWNGWDTFYALGKDADKGDRVTQNIWSKISVLPANNVYYEDDFVTTNADGDQTGTVGIVYTEEWTTDGRSDNNTANTDNSHGEWVEGDSRANDLTYSDGTAHKGSAGATASFTFTGTGVDIYSRTDMTTGTVVAQLKGENGDGQPVNKLYIVDNYSNDHDGNCNAVPYYQIPTVTFGNLDYGTYTVTITVTTAAAGRSTYYLDGIRVYNPLGNSLDETVKEAYGPTELNATFTEVRSLLSGNGDWSEGTTIGGAVYIDQIEGQSTPVFAVYEKDGPKDEVYLSNGQAIAFAVDDPDATYYIGLKGPQGETSAEISNGNNNSKPQITSASDLYYKVMPYSHTDAEHKTTYFIMVKNTGDNLLSVTKLRVTGSAPAVSEAPAPTSFSLSAMRSYINTFDTLETVAYTAAPEDAEGSEEAPEVTEPDNTEGETSEIVPPEDVVIENPEPAEPEQPAVSPIRKILNKIFNGFRGLFQR